MADTTKLIIEIESLLKGLPQTLRGLERIRKSLESVVNVRATEQSAKRVTENARRAELQQQRLSIVTQELANRQERARQQAERLVLSQQRLDKQTERSTNQTIAFNRSLLGIGNSLRSIGQGLASFGATLSFTVSAPLIGFGAAVTNAAVTLDSLRRGLTAIVGDADEANRQLARLTEIAKLPGIGFEEAIQGSIRLQAVGFSAKEAEAALRQFSNAIALTGGGRDELARVNTQLGQLAAKGKVLSQDLRPIIESAPAVGRALLQAFGTVNADDIQELGLSTREFFDILVSQLAKLPRAAAGARNTFENFRDAVFRAAATVGEVLIPTLTKLIEIAEPVITRLANGFKALPSPLQTLVVVIGGLTIALGPVLFVVGQLTLGIGRLVVGVIQLTAANTTATASLTGLGAAAGAASRGVGALAVSTAAAAAPWILLAGVVVTAVAALALLATAGEKTVKVTDEQIAATENQISALEKQLKFVNSLEDGVKRTGEEQDRLRQIYASLNVEAQARIKGAADETEELRRLRIELQQLINLRNEERIQQAANLAVSLDNTLQQIEANQKNRDSITEMVRANARLIESIEETGKITEDQRRQLNDLGITTFDTASALNNLRFVNQNLVKAQNALIEASEKLKGTAEEQSKALAELEQRLRQSSPEIFTLAKNFGLFDGRVEDATKRLDAFRASLRETVPEIERANAALSEGERQLNAAGARAEAAAKRRQTIIQSSAAVARETSLSFESALKSLREMVEAVPELGAAIRREAQLQGKSIEEILRSSLENAFKGREKSRSETALRNAQEQLAKALSDIALAEAERQTEGQKLQIQERLRANENEFKLNLQSLNAYLSTRAALTKQAAQLEIDEQQRIVDEAIKAQERLLATAGKAGVKPAERTRAQAGAKDAEERAIKAQTKILELKDRQKQADEELTQALAENAKTQIEAIRQLDIEFADLRGAIQDALDTAVIEKYRERLKALALDQETLNKRIRAATAARKADDVIALEEARQRNQSEIDAINLIVQQKFALNELVPANNLIERAKERQVQLEKELAFEVEFRGLSEQEALRRRLEGERKLADSLTNSRDQVQLLINILTARGIQPPQALLDFIRDINLALKGLGEIGFTEQFQIAQRKFERLNDERLRRIADVENAVRRRDIAEAEGLLLIRRINGEYIGDLERQVELLRQIAKDSGRPELQRQAEQARQTAIEANMTLTDLSKVVRSTSIDAAKSGLTDFLSEIGRRGTSAKEQLLDLVDSVANAIRRVIAERLAEKFIDSLFGGSKEGAGILAAFGLGQPKTAPGGIGGALAGAGGSAAQTAALTTGATAAGTALTTGGIAAATALTTAAAAFSASVIAAGAAFAAAVAASVGTQSGAAFARFIGGAATGLFPAEPGGLIRVVEGGYPEAVLTTDPTKAVSQAKILRDYLNYTKGLFGRIPGFADGGFPVVSRETAELNLLSSIHRAPSSLGRVSDVAVAGGGQQFSTLRQIFVDDQRDVANWVNSANGDRTLVQWVVRNRTMLSSLLDRRGR